jgi:hypothetical protein
VRPPAREFAGVEEAVGVAPAKQRRDGEGGGGGESTMLFILRR